MRFWKYHGLGNDFIIMNNLDNSISLRDDMVEIMCHRRFGIGADGVVLVQNSDIADVKMVIYNSDGSRAEMCGNAIRCFALYVFNKGIVNKPQIAVETDAGVMYIDINLEKDVAVSAVVNMGKPDFDASRIVASPKNLQQVNEEIKVGDETFYITSLLMGVPHTVIFTDKLDDEYIKHYGKLIENHSLFPKKTNVNFVKVVSRDNIILRTWERGAGYTYACGTGACASVAAGVTQGLINEKVKVELRGGELSIHWRDRGDIYMEGPAVEIYEGFFNNN